MNWYIFLSLHYKYYLHYNFKPNRMKKRFLKAVVLVAVSICSVGVSAQPMPQLPLDPSVRMGRLENGLTYYIRHNELPKDRAEFYIAQRVGSILEEESQLGLAHFLEHMAFNGTKNFPDKTMLDYLERNGVKFGTNINAYTGTDETVYNLSSVPTTNPGLVDSALLVLHDWSGFITLDNDEIDNERHVINEEWRTRSNASLRMLEYTILPALYPNNRYAERMPIGKMDVVMNFPYQALRDYYHMWYRPDLQGIIVVGDVDVDQIEKRIKELWSDVPKPVNPVERTYTKVEDNVAPIIAIAADKESTRNSLYLMYKQDPMPDSLKNTQIGLAASFTNDLISSMINTRFSELAQKADAPFLGAGQSYGNFFIAPTKDAISFIMAFKDGEWEKGLTAMMSVIRSVDEYGFTQSELDRAIADMESQLENQYNERDKMKNSEIVEQLLDNYLHNAPAPGIELEYAFFTQLFKAIPLEYINEHFATSITPENVAIAYMGTEKEGVKTPSNEEMLAAFSLANETPAIAYVDEVSTEPLVKKLLKAGKVKGDKKGELGTTVWTLSNGAKVIYKRTDFKKDQIVMTATSPGGTSLFADADLINSKVIDGVIGLGGVGQFSNTELSKVLAGKRAAVSPYISGVAEGLNGEASPKDLETMMQLTYLYFTQPRQDKDAYQAWYQRTYTTLQNLKTNPDMQMRDSLMHLLYDGNPRKKPLTSEELQQVSYERIGQLYKERFANAGDFTFVFVGNVDEAELKPLVEKYIASLPAKGKPEVYKEVEPRMVSGQVEKIFSMPMATPKVRVMNFVSGSIEYNLKNVLKMAMLRQVMDIVYTETIREQEGGTYGVGTSGLVSLQPSNQYYFMYDFDTSEDKKERLSERAYVELVNIAEHGPNLEAFSKVKEYLLKKHAEDVKENGYWMNQIVTRERFNKETTTAYSETLNALTMDDIRDFAKQLIAKGNRAQMIVTGVIAE